MKKVVTVILVIIAAVIGYMLYTGVAVNDIIPTLKNKITTRFQASETGITLLSGDRV
jgi:hypothetical protein